MICFICLFVFRTLSKHCVYFVVCDLIHLHDPNRGRGGETQKNDTLTNADTLKESMTTHAKAVVVAAAAEALR